MALSSKRPSKDEEVKAKILEDIKDEGGKKKRLNAEIEENLYKKIKMRAIEEGRTVSDITRELWITHLNTKVKTSFLK